MKLAWLLTALLACVPASASPRAEDQGADTFREKVADVARTAADPAASPASIWEKGQNLYLNRVNVVVQPNLRGWDFGREALGDGKEKSVDDLITGGERALSDLGRGVPPPELRDAVAGTRDSYRRGLVQFDATMNPQQMGRFLFTEGRGDTGLTQINQRMALMAGVIGLPFAFMTPLHEWVHEKWHNQGRLSARRVIEGELPAFMAQFEWLRYIDPYGERLAYARTWLRNQIAQGRGGAVAADGLRYLDHAAEVRATEGDREKMLDLIERLGYRDGHFHGDGHEHGDNVEPHPTRA